MLLAVSAVLAVVFYYSGGSENMVTTIINWALVLSGVAVLGAIVMPVFFSNGKLRCVHAECRVIHRS